MDSSLAFKTVHTPSEGLYKEKGSKFLSFAIPVQSEEDVKDRLDQFKKDYYDARHICFAYILGHKKDKCRAYDDGEPNHSAGNPILNQIKSYDLSDTLVVVVRYFGGTKLGVSGLISAYKAAAQSALNEATIIKKTPLATLEHSFTYENMNKVMSIVKEYDLKIISQNYELECGVTLSVPLHLVDKVKNILNH